MEADKNGSQNSEDVQLPLHKKKYDYQRKQTYNHYYSLVCRAVDALRGEASPVLELQLREIRYGNSVTTQRICEFLRDSPNVRRCKAVNVYDIRDTFHLAGELVEQRISFVVGIHAYRSGRLLIDCGVPFVIVISGTDLNSNAEDPEKMKVMRAALSQAIAVVCFSAESRSRLIQCVPSISHKVQTIPQAVTLGGYQPAVSSHIAAVRLKLDVREDESLLLLPAGLRPVKDVLFCISAFLRLRLRAPDRRAVLRLVGPELDAAYAARVHAALKKDVERSALYCGSLERNDLFAAMESAAVVLNTSQSEGMCNSVLEAMLLGRPLVARRNDGNSNLISHGVNGMLFDTVEEMVDQILQLLPSAPGEAKMAQALGREARETAHRRHNPDQEAVQYQQLPNILSSRDFYDTDTRDTAFIGLPLTVVRPESSSELEDLDVYGSLRGKRWRGDRAWLEDHIKRAHEAFLAAVPPGELPQRPGLNPVAWSIGHVAFTFDAIVAIPLRLPTAGVIPPFSIAEYEAHLAVHGPSNIAGSRNDSNGIRRQGVLRSLAWTLYDSMRVGRAERWILAEKAQLPNARPYLAQVVGMCRALLSERVDKDGKIPPVESYLLLYACIHMLWHTEDVTHTRNANGLSAPPVGWGVYKTPFPPFDGTELVSMQTTTPDVKESTTAPDDVSIPGGVFYLGAKDSPDAPLVFDSEKGAHKVRVKPFRIARCCVTNAEYAAFVDAGGYEDESYWDFEGVRWLRASGQRQPYKWVRRAAATRLKETGACAQWRIRWFDAELPLPPRQPVSHITWHEARAYCEWAQRRLPTETEWEIACCGHPSADGALQPVKDRLHPWGAWDASRAHLGCVETHLLDVDAMPAGDSAWGCRQMLGNVWEWTATTLYPYPGFVMDFPYREQSAPWFGTQKVARGGCFATPALLMELRGGEYRSFYDPAGRQELAVGFRTCALG